jgi:hypothetical protein
MSAKLPVERVTHYIIKQWALDVGGSHKSYEIPVIEDLLEILEDFGCLNKRGLEVKEDFISLIKSE